MVSSLFFFLAPSDCKSLQCLISTLTQGGKGGHLFRLTCSVVLWGGRNTVNKYHWHAWGVLIVDGPHWVCHRQIATAKAVCISWVHTAQAPGFSARVLSQVGPAFHAHPRSKWLRFLVLLRGTDRIGCAFCALPRMEHLRWPGAWWVHCLRWAVHLIHLPSPSCLVSQVCYESTVPGVLCVSSGELISGCDTPGWCELFRIPGKRD